MSWQSFFSKIYVINLIKRKDRLLDITEEMFKYGIDFDLVDGIEHENGAEGLKLTVEGIFKDAIEKKYEHILIFEDDCLFVQDPNPIMEKVIKQLPERYDIIFLSCQATQGFISAYSENLLLLHSAYATHAAFYSLQGMKEILAAGLKAPVDNFYVTDIEIMNNCYAIRPILATQREGFSDIGKTMINWSPFILDRFNQKLQEI